MPRKKQAVQKKKREKVYRPGELSGDTRHIKPKGAFKLFTNYKLFAIIGVGVLASSFVFSALYRGGNSGSSHARSVRGTGVGQTTAEAGTAVASGASGSIKQYSAPPAPSIDPNKTYSATIKTNQGDIKIQLNAKDAPATVNNFVFLAKDGFYDGSTFYRVIADKDGNVHFAQAGDPTGTGSGGPGYDLPVESTPGQPFDVPGILAMAKPNEAGKPNNGSQFFFTLQSEPTLNGRDTAFGKVVEGIDVLKGLPVRDPQTQQNPDPGVRIDSITINET